MALLSSQDAAAALAVTPRAVHKMVQRGTLRAVKIGNAFAFTPAAIESARSRRGRGRPPAKHRKK